jgi:phosphocarrier protein
MGLLGRKNTAGEGKSMVREFTILNRLGLHARPASMFVKVCNRHKCDIWIRKDEEEVNGKSIMGLMMLAAGQGSKLRITCTGHDAGKALDEIGELIARKFDED